MNGIAEALDEQIVYHVHRLFEFSVSQFCCALKKWAKERGKIHWLQMQCFLMSNTFVAEYHSDFNLSGKFILLTSVVRSQAKILHSFGQMLD